MHQWTEIEFERIVINTKLSDRTKSACRDVLVEGLSGKDAAERHNVLPPQISRALGILRGKREELMRPIDKEEYEANKELAIHAARSIMDGVMQGPLEVRDPKPGQICTGPVIVNEHGFVVQKVGRYAVIHDAKKLDGIVGLKGDVEIQYPYSNSSPVRVKDNAIAKEDKGVSR